MPPMKRQSKVRSFDEVEGHDRVGASDGEVGRATHPPSRSDSLGPEDCMRRLVPVAVGIVDRLVQRLSNVVVGPFDYAVRLRVVAGDADMVDAVVCTEVLVSGDERRTVVSDNLS